MAERRSQGSRKLVRCGHCDEVSKRTFYQHKRLYYDPKSKAWSNDKRVFHDSSGSRSTFDPDFECQSQESSSSAMNEGPASSSCGGEGEVMSDGKF